MKSCFKLLFYHWMILKFPLGLLWHLHMKSHACKPTASF